MPDLHTHYDNLKVARNAPPEVIRAAYKTLSQKFHPDRHPDNQSATRTFQIIHSAYEVLSDPVKRREHDQWIALSEGKGAAAQDGEQTASSTRGAKPGKHAAGTTAAESDDYSWLHRTSFAVPSSSRSSGFRAWRHLLRGGLSKRQAVSYIFASCAATLVLFVLLAGH